MRPLNIMMKAFIAGAVTAMGIISAQAADKLTVRLDFIAWGTHAAMHLANEKGWFKEAGLDVEVQDGTGSGNTIQLVAAGQADIGQVQLGVMAVAKEKGADLISIAGWFRKSDLAVLVDRDSPISTIADLKGKSIVNFAPVQGRADGRRRHRLPELRADRAPRHACRQGRCPAPPRRGPGSRLAVHL